MEIFNGIIEVTLFLKGRQSKNRIFRDKETTAQKVQTSQALTSFFYALDWSHVYTVDVRTRTSKKVRKNNRDIFFKKSTYKNSGFN